MTVFKNCPKCRLVYVVFGDNLLFVAFSSFWILYSISLPFHTFRNDRTCDLQLLSRKLPSDTWSSSARCGRGKGVGESQSVVIRLVESFDFRLSKLASFASNSVALWGTGIFSWRSEDLLIIKIAGKLCCIIFDLLRIILWKQQVQLMAHFTECSIWT